MIGYLDELLLIPAGIWRAQRLLPVEVLAECREIADEDPQLSTLPGDPAALVIIITWFAAVLLILHFLLR